MKQASKNSSLKTQQKIHLAERKIWSAGYREVGIEIVHWKSKRFSPAMEHLIDGDNWNYYIYLYEYKLNDFDKLWLKPSNQYTWGAEYNYYSLPISDAFWHGGITFYQKLENDSINNRIIKVGCDYQHSNDYDYTYDLNYVLTDAIQTVEDLYNILDFKKEKTKQ